MGRRLEREAAERALRRASERDGASDLPDVIDEEVLVEAAVEAGIDERAVRESIAIEGLGPAPSRRRLDRVAGRAAVLDERLVELPADQVLDLVDDWLVTAHHLRRDRRRGGTGEWSRRGDAAGRVKRGTASARGDAGLGSVRRIRASVSPVDDASCVVRVWVDRSRHRRRRLATGSTFVAGGGAAVTAGVIVAPPIAVLAVPAVAMGSRSWSSGRRQADRFERELWRLLDAVDRGDRPPNLGSAIRNRLARRR